MLMTYSKDSIGTLIKQHCMKNYLLSETKKVWNTIKAKGMADDLFRKARDPSERACLFASRAS